MKDRNYKKEYEDYHKDHYKENLERHQARRKMGLVVGDPREVDHKKPLSKGGSNHKNNLKVTSQKKNRKKGVS